LPYDLLAHRVAQKELDALPKDIADGLRKALRALAAAPHDARFRLKALAGAPPERPPYLRLRLGDYRVILRIDDKRRQVRVVRIGHRSTVYRDVAGLDD
jgi:mRNA interferase RelE/StbE